MRRRARTAKLDGSCNTPSGFGRTSGRLLDQLLVDDFQNRVEELIDLLRSEDCRVRTAASRLQFCFDDLEIFRRKEGMIAERDVPRSERLQLFDAALEGGSPIRLILH